jgi:hypothetical protein
VTGEVKMRTTKKAQGAARNHKCHSTRAQLEKTKRRRGKIREQDFFEDRDLWLSRPRVDPNTFSDPSQGPEEVQSWLRTARESKPSWLVSLVGPMAVWPCLSKSLILITKSQLLRVI